MEPTKNRTIQFQNMHVLEKNKAHTMNCIIFYSTDVKTLIITIQSNEILRIWSFRFMIQEYNSTEKLFLVILKCFIYIVFRVVFWFWAFCLDFFFVSLVGCFVFNIFVSLGKELMFIKWGKRPIVPNYDSLKSVKPIAVKT